MDIMAVIRDLSTLILTAVAVISMISVLKYRVIRNETESKEDREKTDNKVDSLSRDVAALLAEVKGLAREQAVVNKFSADALSSLNKKVEGVEHTVAEHGQLVSLVRELIRRVDHINVEP